MARMLGARHGLSEVSDHYCCPRCTPGAKERGRRAQRAAEDREWRLDQQADTTDGEPSSRGEADA